MSTAKLTKNLHFTSKCLIHLKQPFSEHNPLLHKAEEGTWENLVPFLTIKILTPLKNEISDLNV